MHSFSFFTGYGKDMVFQINDEYEESSEDVSTIDMLRIAMNYHISSMRKNMKENKDVKALAKLQKFQKEFSKALVEWETSVIVDSHAFNQQQ